MTTTRILALAASGLITALLFAAIANGMSVKPLPGVNSSELRHESRAPLP